MELKMKFRIATTVLVVLLSVVISTDSQEVKLKKWVIGSGGMVNLKNDQGISLSGQLGQTAIGKITGLVDGKQLAVYQGFWVPAGLSPDAVPEEDESAIFSLTNYPNPFAYKTTIHFTIPSPGYVTVRIFNMTGMQVAALFESNTGTGDIELFWDAKDGNGALLSSGNYICELLYRPALGFSMNKSSYSVRKVMVVTR